MNEASSFHQNLEEEQISNMIETGKLLLGEMRRRNDDLGRVEESCDLLSEELRKIGRQVEEMNDRLQSLIGSVKKEVEEDVKPKLGNDSRLPLCKILPSPKLFPLHKMPRV